MTALYISLGCIGLLFLLLFSVVRSWQRTPEGLIEWKLALILRIYRGREKRRKGEAEDISAYRELSAENMLRFIDPYLDFAHTEDAAVPGPAGEVPVRIFRPDWMGKGDGAAASAFPPIIVFFHGGGFVAGSVKTHDPLCRRLARETASVVVSADYRLAPEHPFPAAPEDCYSVLCWAAEHAEELGCDPERLVLAGDSAGGNLAAVAALQSRDKNGPPVAMQILIYPSTNGCFMGLPSHTSFTRGYFLEIGHMEWLCDQYVPDPADRSHPYASPLKAGDFTGLPPALIITARFDPMRDEGAAYAGELKAAGVPVIYRCFPGVTHGFLGMPKTCRAAEHAFKLIADTVRGGSS